MNTASLMMWIMFFVSAITATVTIISNKKIDRQRKKMLEEIKNVATKSTDHKKMIK